MNQNERKTVMRRMVLLIAVAALVMGLYALRLIFLQLVNDDEYKSQATNTTDYNFTVTAAAATSWTAPASALPPRPPATTWCSTSCRWVTRIWTAAAAGGGAV